ncbi:MAG: MFS transporter [Chloroflexi bacterium]|nr:MFS transporter [Chloroflexota bacterium]
MSASGTFWNRNLVIAVSTGFLNTVGNGLWSALLPLYYRQLGASDSEIGVAFTVALLANTFLQAVGGLMADRIGRRTILFAMLGATPMFLIAGTTSDWRIVLLAYSGTRMLMGTQWPALFALISESVPREAQARAFSLFEFSIGLGMTVGPALGALCISQFNMGIGSLMVIHGLIIAGTALARGSLMREGPRGAPPSARQLRAAVSPNLIWFAVSICLFALAETLTLSGPFYTLFSADVWKASETEINLLTSAASLTGVAFGLWGGHWADRTSNRRVIIAGCLGTTLTLIAWMVAPTLAWGVVPVLANFMVVELALIAQQAEQSRLTTPETRASVVGVLGAVQGFVSAGGPVVGAQLTPLFGPAAPFALGALISLASAWAMGRVKK